MWFTFHFLYEMSWGELTVVVLAAVIYANGGNAVGN